MAKYLRNSVAASAVLATFTVSALAHPGHDEPVSLSQKLAHGFASGEILLTLIVAGLILALVLSKRVSH